MVQLIMPAFPLVFVFNISWHVLVLGELFFLAIENLLWLKLTKQYKSCTIVPVIVSFIFSFS